MRFLPTLLLFTALCSTSQVVTAQASLILQIDGLGEVSIVNNGTQTFDFDGYSLICAAGCLNPNGWLSIEDQVITDPLAVVSLVGSGGLGFAEAAPTMFQLSELTLSSGAVLRPQSAISLGRPINGSIDDIRTLVDSGSLNWEWTSPTFGTQRNAGITIAAVPEPSSIYCFAMTAIFGLLWNSRASRS